MSEEYGHTAGAVDGFRPNMTPSEMAELDRRRGLGDQGSFNDPDIIVNKRPWLKPDGTHKSQGDAAMQDGMMDLIRAISMPEGGKPFGKPLPEKREGETEFERDIRHYTDVVRDNPKKYTGGRKQAIAIAANEAGVAKKGSTMHNPFKKCVDTVDKGPPPIPSTAQGVISSAPKPPGLGMGPKPAVSASPPKQVRPMGLSPSIKGVDGKDKDEDGEFADKLFGKTVMPGAGAAPTMAPPSPPPAMAGTGMATSTMKALRAGSFFIPPPLQTYDPFNVHRNAHTIPVAKATVGEDAAPVRLGEVYKSCDAHGITYKASQGCHPCTIQKSSVCKNCGTTMMKTAGGTLSCPRGH